MVRVERTASARRTAAIGFAIALPPFLASLGAFFASWPLDMRVPIFAATVLFGIGGIAVITITWVLAIWATSYLHEPIHAATYLLLTGNPRNTVKISFTVRAGHRHTAYTVPVPPRVYRTQLVMPCLLLAALPIAVGLAAGSLTLVFIGACHLGGAGGDLYQLWRLRDVPGSALIEDHPDKPGHFVVYPA